MWLPGALAPLPGCHANVKCACSGKTGRQCPDLNARVNLTEHNYSGAFQWLFPSLLKTKRHQHFWWWHSARMHYLRENTQCCGVSQHQAATFGFTKAGREGEWRWMSWQVPFIDTSELGSLRWVLHEDVVAWTVCEALLMFWMGLIHFCSSVLVSQVFNERCRIHYKPPKSQWWCGIFSIKVVHNCESQTGKRPWVSWIGTLQNQ